MGVKGLRVNVEKFKKFLKEQGEIGIEGLAINLALGLGIQKTLDWVSRIAHLSPKGEQIMDFVVTESLAGLQLTLSGSAVGVVIGVGILLANPVIKLIGFLKSRSGERRKANDTPEKVYGTQFARVRSEDENGVVTWYPGILASKDLWTGIGSREQNIRINYGKLEDLHWRYNKNGSFSPYFDHPRYKMINAKDRDLKEYSSEAQRTKYDPLRDFSLFTFDETDNMFSTLVEGKDLSAFQEKADDRSNLGGYMQELISYRDDFEWIRKFNTGGEEIGRHLDPADRSIRREFEHSKLSDPMYVQGRSFVYADMMDDKKYKAGFSTHKKELKENKALLQYFHGRMTDLLRSQKIAAEETPGFLESLKGIGKYNDTYNYTLYALDTGMSPAHSLDELKAQIDKTQARDIPWFQKNYLEQKNIVRYFAKKLSNRALGGDIVHAATYPHQQTYRMDAKNEQTALNYSGILNAAGTFRLQQVGHTSVFGNPPGPWSNSDEGVIPKWLFEDKFIGHLGGGKKDYIAEAQRLHMLMQNQFVSPGLRNTKFKPGKVFVDSNPFLSEGFHTKFMGIVSDKDTGEHRYDRKSERLYDETADEKKARLAAEKKQIGEHGRKKGSLDPFVRVTPAKKVEEKPLTGDPTKRNDKFYADNKDYTWDFDKKRFILKAGGIGQGPRGGKPTLSEHDKQMEHERKSRGFTKSRWEHYLRKHGGKTPDQVEGVGRYSGWHVNIHGGVHPGAKKPDPGVKHDPSSKPVVTKIPKVIPKVIPKAIPKVQPPSVHLSALQEYLRDQHGMNVSKEAINSKAIPFLAFDEKGRPALYGDPILHKKMGLPDAYRVVTGPTGYIHKSYDPEKVQPKFFSQHETSVVERY